MLSPSTDTQAFVLPELSEVWQSTLFWQPNGQQQAQFQQLYDCILAGNRQFNLTRITEPTEFWEKHLWDSLRGIQTLLGADPDVLTLQHPGPEVGNRPKLKVDNFPGSRQVIDIGTGAGFPGLPIAIAQPDWAVTLLDATRKKMDFLNQVLAIMGLTNGRTVTDRVEAVGHQRGHRGRYDLALVRAVAAASVCAEYALPLLQVGGVAMLYRGQWTEEEGSGLAQVVEQLGGEIEAVERFATPISGSDRTLVHLRKIAPTPPTFPRPIGIPTQKPLV